MGCVLLCSMFAASCSSSASDTATATIVLDQGLETSLSDDPAPTRLLARARSTDGSEKPLFDGPVPADRRVPLGEVSTGTPIALVIEGRDANGDVVLRGGTPFLYPAGDLPVLVGRPATATRLSQPLAAPATASVLVGARYLFSAANQTGTLFDLARLDSLRDTRGLPRTVHTLLSVGSIAVLIDETGASSIDTSTGEAGINSLGGAAAIDVVEGVAVVGSDGTYLVGPSRTSGAKTSTVLRFSDTANVVTLAHPRIGAAAGWIEGTGLVVTAGDSEAPPEVIAAGAATPKLAAVTLPARRGGVLAPLADGAFVLLGGIDPSTGGPAETSKVTLSCASNCVGTMGPPVDLVSGKGHSAGAGRAFVVGNTATGETRAYLVDGTSVKKVELKTPRRNGDSVAVGDGFVIVVGGTDAAGAPVLGLEQLTP